MDHFEGIRQLWKGPKMDLKQEGKKVVEKADAKLTSLTELVTRKGWTKWAVLGAIAFVVVVVALLLWPGKARATGYEHAVKVVIVKATSSPAVAAPAVAAQATAPASAAVPAQQSASGGGGGSSWLASGGLAFIGTGIFLAAVGVSHFLFCAEDDKKKREERVCYRPLRDGMP
jgi:hypothetical protein